MALDSRPIIGAFFEKTALGVQLARQWLFWITLMVVMLTVSLPATLVLGLGWTNWLVAMLIVQTIRIPITLFLIGKLKPRDVFLSGRHILPAAFLLVAIWASLQLLNTIQNVVLATPLLSQTHMVGNSGNGEYAASVVIGSFSEEILMRGFVMVQAFKRMLARWPTKRLRSAILSIILSAVVFGLLHLPGRIFNGMTQFIPLLMLFSKTLIVGLVLGVVFFLTGNLFVSAGVHVLLNLPLNLIQFPGGDLTQWALSLACILLITWLCSTNEHARKFIQVDGSRVHHTGNC